MARAIGEHLAWLRLHNYSPRTVRMRDFYLNAFAQWLEERGVTRPTDVTKPMLERYQRHLFHQRKVADGKPLSFSFQHQHLCALRGFFRWAARQNRILYNPASELEPPRRVHRLPRHVLTVSEVEQVLAQPDVTDPLGLRDRAMLETLYSTGMRRSELCGLTLVDLDAERGTVLIRQGKGQKDRMVPIGERAIAWVDRYVAEVRSQLVVEPDPGVLFLAATGEAVGPDWLSRITHRYVDRAALGKQGSCHLLRHTMATLMLEGGADVRYIQEMLGHARLETTEVYTHVAIRQLKAVHTATHPGATLRRHLSASIPPTPPVGCPQEPPGGPERDGPDR
jgi:integrase/recombinase XerD